MCGRTKQVEYDLCITLLLNQLKSPAHRSTERRVFVEECTASPIHPTTSFFHDSQEQEGDGGEPVGEKLIVIGKKKNVVQLAQNL